MAGSGVFTKWDPQTNPVMQWVEWVIRHGGADGDQSRANYDKAMSADGAAAMQSKLDASGGQYNHLPEAAQGTPITPPADPATLPVGTGGSGDNEASKRMNQTFAAFRGQHKGTGNLNLLKAQYLTRQGRDTTEGQKKLLLQAASRRATPKMDLGLPDAPNAPAVASRTSPGSVPARTRGRRK